MLNVLILPVRSHGFDSLPLSDSCYIVKTLYFTHHFTINISLGYSLHHFLSESYSSHGYVLAGKIWYVFICTT